ncbi:MAG: hypothetical protein SFV54_05505 [Bryobacteraceae bacterium]|nr:hypothetical protein [Bryobacteraceae bacterium]
MKHRLLILALAPVAAFAQLSLSGPVLGYVFDEKAQAVRVLDGVPGASRPGRLLAAGLKSAAIASSRGFALALTADDQTPVLVTLETAEVRRFDEWKSGAAGLVLSPSASSAILLYAGKGVVVSGLPAEPKVEREIDLPAETAALAISDDAGRVLVAERDASLVAYEGGDPQPVGGLEKISALAFLRGSREAVAASVALQEIYYLREDGHLILSAAADGLGETVAVAASPDRKRAFAALASGSIAAFELAGGTPVLTSCYCKPVALDPMSASGVFRLTPFTDLPMMLFDASGSEAQVLFVPPAIEEEQ